MMRHQNDILHLDLDNILGVREYFDNMKPILWQHTAFIFRTKLFINIFQNWDNNEMI